MKRSLFLVSVGTLAVAAGAPRLAGAQTRATPVRIVRRVKLRRIADAGRCVTSRKKNRWSGFSASDFQD
jgi:hypothetical protein